MSNLSIFDNFPISKESILSLQKEVLKLPQYQPITKHYFHGGMYCREVYRDADVLVIGGVHKSEHFYVIASGTVVVTTDNGIEKISGPRVIKSLPGTKRAVYSETPSVCLTFHKTDAKTVEEAAEELFEKDENSMYDSYNNVKGVLT